MSNVRRSPAVERTMIGHDDAVHARLHRRMCVLHRLHALHHERPVPVLAQEGEVLPRPELPRGRFLHPPVAKFPRRNRLFVSRRELLAERLLVKREGWALVRAHCEAHALHEYRVRSTDLGTDRCCEGEIRSLEVVWAPAENEGVEGDDERGEARRLGAAHYRERQVVAALPTFII